MSSHHFVKEGQEPALIIADEIPLSVAGPLLEWAPIVIVLEEALDLSLIWGIKADIIICSPESTSQVKEKTAFQVPLEIISADDNFLQTAIERLIQKDHFQANVCTSKVNHVLAQSNAYISMMDLSVFAEHSRYSGIRKENFQKWMAAQTRFSIITQSQVTVSGKVKVVDNLEYEVLDDTLISISSTAPFWLKEY